MATRLTYTGDKFQGLKYRWQAEKMLDYLEWAVQFLNKKQLASRRKLANGVVITCNYVYGQRIAVIHYPVTKHKKKVHLPEEVQPDYPFVFGINGSPTVEIAFAFNNPGKVQAKLIKVNSRPNESKSFDTFNYQSKRFLITGNALYWIETTIPEGEELEYNKFTRLALFSDPIYEVEAHYTPVIKLMTSQGELIENPEKSLRCIWAWNRKVWVKEITVDAEEETVTVTRGIEYTCRSCAEGSLEYYKALYSHIKPIIGKDRQRASMYVIPLSSAFLSSVTYENCEVWFCETLISPVAFDQNTRWSKQLFNFEDEELLPEEVTGIFPRGDATGEKGTVAPLIVGGGGALTENIHLFDYTEKTTVTATDDIISYTEYEDGDPPQTYICQSEITKDRTSTMVEQNVNPVLIVDTIDIPTVSEYTLIEEDLQGYAAYIRKSDMETFDHDWTKYQGAYLRNDQGVFPNRVHNGSIWHIKALVHVTAVGYRYLPVTEDSSHTLTSPCGISAPDVTGMSLLNIPSEHAIAYNYDFASELFELDIYYRNDGGSLVWSDASTNNTDGEYIIQGEFYAFQHPISCGGVATCSRLAESGMGRKVHNTSTGKDAYRAIYLDEGETDEFEVNCLSIFDPVLNNTRLINGDIDTFVKLDNRHYPGEWNNGIVYVYREHESLDYVVMYNGIDCTEIVSTLISSLGYSLNDLTQVYMV